MLQNTALVLSGGGARGAYQAGVIKALVEIAESVKVQKPFQTLVGNSAGAINTVFLAAGAQNMTKAANGLVQLWSTIEADQVFCTDLGSMSKIGASWIKDIMLGSLSGKNSARAFLDTKPLWKLLHELL